MELPIYKPNVSFAVHLVVMSSMDKQALQNRLKLEFLEQPSYIDLLDEIEKMSQKTPLEYVNYVVQADEMVVVEANWIDLIRS